MEEDRFRAKDMEGFVGEKEEFVGHVSVWCAAELKFCTNWSLIWALLRDLEQDSTAIVQARFDKCMAVGLSNEVQVHTQVANFQGWLDGAIVNTEKKINLLKRCLGSHNHVSD